MGTSNEKLGAKLKQIRKKNGFTQKAIAAYLEVDKKCLARFEAGENTLSVDGIEKLATLFGVDIFTIPLDVDKIKPIKLPFSANKITKEELENIYVINKMALNINFMDKLLKINGVQI
jgi:transcriptional regulator with XRE-family HTH domain